LTLKSGYEVLFIDGEARRAAGHYVPFVQWFNFSAGFFYIITAIALWMRSRRSALLALLLAVTTLIVLAAFGLHIFNGGEYEMRTVIAMTLRSAVWIVIAIFARQYFKRHNNDDYT
jgi:predicted exporter